MEVIKIFIGSSVDKKEFELERERLGSFINGLNRKYIKQGIFIDFYDCETVSNKMRAEGSQKQHDDYIENEADATFFMFFKKAGEFTLHELQVARDALVSKNRPDIFTYFKVVGDDIEQTEEIKKAVDIIANSYGHYYSIFTDVDTIKLGMLQYIADKLNDGSTVTINDGKIYLNNTEISGISIDNIIMYQKNDEYRNLHEEIDDLTKAIDAAIENKEFKEIEALTVKKEEKEKTLATLESDILNTLIQMQKELNKGNVSPLLKQAYKLFEIGKVKEAQQLIPIDVLKLKSKNLLLKKEMHEQDNKELVENAKIRIGALKLDVTNVSRFNMIADTFESVLENAFLCCDNIFVFNYCYFLDDQNNSPKAYETVKRLEGLYLLNANKFELLDVAKLYNLIGVICDHLSLTKEEEQYSTQAIEIWEQLAKENPERFNTGLADSYNHAGIFYNAQGNAEKAEHYYTKAIEIREKLAKDDPERYNTYLADIYNNAGIFYYNQDKIGQAENYYSKAIEIREQLAKENPERYNVALALSYTHMGAFYTGQGNAERVEECYIKAIEIREQLAKENPERYNSDLADSYNNAGVFYNDQGNAERVEYYFSKAIEIREQLTKVNPKRYSYRLADSYNNAGVFYQEQGNTEKAEYYYTKAIEIGELLVKDNPERYTADLAHSYYNYGLFTKDNKYFDKALKLAKTQPNNQKCRKIILALGK